MEQRIKSGDIVKHFKKELIAQDAESEMTFTVDGIDTATNSRVVVYRALYGTHTIFVRPYDDFMSEVDRVKYPSIQQKYRFERV